MINYSTSNSFELLDRRIQRWIWEHEWTELRNIQEEAIPPILSHNMDVILSSGTASGKTEAAFFPILTHMLQKNACNDSGVISNTPVGLEINFLFFDADIPPCQGCTWIPSFSHISCNRSD